MQGEENIDLLMIPVLKSIKRHVTSRDAITDIYNRAYEAVMISLDVKNEQRHIEFCPNCEADVPCTHEAELYVCDICGEDFAKYIVLRNCNVSDVSVTQDVLMDIKKDLSDAEIEELGAQEAERKEFCPNCEADVPCTHEAELFVCDFDTDNWRPGYALGMFELMKEKLARERQVSDALYLLLVDDPNTKLKADQILINIYGKCEPSTSDVSTTQDVTTPEPPEGA